LPTKYITAKDVLLFRDEAFLKYYANPRYLEMVQRRFGPETVAHIKDMTSHRLERDLVTGRLNVPLTTLSQEASPPEVPPTLVQVQLSPGAGERVRKTA
jgi:hypothetical protein